MTPQVISYPTITVGGKPYQLRFSHSAWFQLRNWGYSLESGNPIPVFALAAAAAGTVDAKGKWRTAGFERVLDFCDLIRPDGDTDQTEIAKDEAEIGKAVIEALGKVAPKADLTLVQPSAESTEQQPN